MRRPTDAPPSLFPFLRPVPAAAAPVQGVWVRSYSGGRDGFGECRRFVLPGRPAHTHVRCGRPSPRAPETSVTTRCTTKANDAVIPVLGKNRSAFSERPVEWHAPSLRPLRHVRIRSSSRPQIRRSRSSRRRSPQAPFRFADPISGERTGTPPRKRRDPRRRASRRRKPVRFA